MKNFLLLSFILFWFFNLSAQIAGKNDPSFNSNDRGFAFGDGANQPINAIAVQNDGKVILGGEFTLYNGVGKNYLVRLNIDGSIDETFNFGIGPENFIHCIKIQSDGKILIGGEFQTFNGTSSSNLIRLNQDGSLDQSFHASILINGIVFSISLQNDNKIIVGGSFYFIDGLLKKGIVRLNSNGNLDTTFTLAEGSSNDVLSTSIQENGKVVIAGNFMTFNGLPNNYLVRLDSTGIIDTSFHIGTGPDLEIYASVIQVDGKIIICGSFSQYNGLSANRITRLNVDGSIDPTFNIGAGIDGVLYTVSLQNDGKIIIGGDFISVNGIPAKNLARLNVDGTLDVTFTIQMDSNSTIKACAIQSDEKINIGGYFNNINGKARNFNCRLNTNGSLDSSFNYVSGANNSINVMAVQSDGKIIIGGNFTSFNDKTIKGIARLNSDGSIDETFNVGIGFNHNVRAICIQPDGKIIIGGYFTQYNTIPMNHIVRLNADGTLDNSFQIGSGPGASIICLALQQDGKILIGGVFGDYNGISRNSIARINADGTLDESFQIGSGLDGTPYTIVIQNDGKILVGGSFFGFNGLSMNGILRLNEYGSWDGNFMQGEVSGTTFSTCIQSDGKILMSGDLSIYGTVGTSNLIRLNTNGTLDNSLNVDIDPFKEIKSVLLQTDGKIIIGGDFNLVNGIEKSHLARLNEDGSLDETFKIGTGANGSVLNSVLQNDGKILICGNFTSYDGNGRNRIARIENKSDFKNTPLIYPNPNNGNFSIDLEATSEISIVNTIGQIVYFDNLEIGTHAINIENQGNGFYFLKIIQSGTEYNLKFIKNSPY